MKDFLSRIRAKVVHGLREAMIYLGDAAHRRFVTAFVVWAFVHFVGKEIAPEVIDSAVEALVTALAAAWSSRTPKIEGDQ